MVVAYVRQCMCMTATAAYNFSDKPAVHRQSQVQCDIKQLDSETEQHRLCNINVAFVVTILPWTL